MARRSMDGRGCGCACCTPRCMKSLMYKLYNALYSTHTLSHGILEAIQYTAAIQRIHLIHLIQYTAAIQRIHYTSLYTPPLTVPHVQLYSVLHVECCALLMFY